MAGMPWLRGGMQSNSDVARFWRSFGFLEQAQGNAEEATLDGETIGLEQKEGIFPPSALDEHQCWTLNTGGRDGVWRLINVY